MEDLGQLKTALKAVVVSSPVNVTLTALLRDYRNMMGKPLPIAKFGYRDPLQFLKERCGDCFLFRGEGLNTVLIPIVSDNLRHIDEFVRKQKVASNLKNFKGKRYSIQEKKIQPAPDLVVKTFERCKKSEDIPSQYGPAPLRSRKPDVPAIRPITKTQNLEPKNTPIEVEHSKSTVSNHQGNKEDNKSNSGVTPLEAYKSFLRKRLPVYDSTQDLDNEKIKDRDSGKFTSESELQTLSSSSSNKRSQLEQLKAELVQLVLDSAAPIPCTQLFKLYRERYGQELSFPCFGYTTVSALACALEGVERAWSPDGHVLLRPPGPPGTPDPPAAPPRARLRERTLAAPVSKADPEDALPWLDFDPDVFPADCVSFSEGIPPPALGAVPAAGMLELMVGEVYSPSHFWFYRLGPDHHLAMETIMDEMTEYYSKGEGRDRVLAAGAVRVGHYCSSVYEGDWHRALIVSVLDSNTVKVRHVDYGTVERVATGALRPLLRRWARLPAQALRGRLAAVRPAARGRRWPHAACLAFLAMLQQRRLVGNIAHVDREEGIVEMYLIDTTSERDVCLGSELARAGHADRAPPPPADPGARHLFPRFPALEAGAAPSLADIHAYLRDGIALDFVEEYRRHVPRDGPSPPAPAPPPAPAASAVSQRLDNRVPLRPPPSDSSTCSSPFPPDSPEPPSPSDSAAASLSDSPPSEPEPAAPAPPLVASEAPVSSAPTESSIEPVKSTPATPSAASHATRPAPPRVEQRVPPAARVGPAPRPPVAPSLPPAPSMPVLPFFVFPPPLGPYHPCPPLMPPFGATQRPFYASFDGPYPPGCFPAGGPPSGFGPPAPPTFVSTAPTVYPPNCFGPSGFGAGGGPPNAPRPLVANFNPAPQPTTAKFTPAPHPAAVNITPAPHSTTAKFTPAPHPAAMNITPAPAKLPPCDPALDSPAGSTSSVAASKSTSTLTLDGGGAAREGGSPPAGRRVTTGHGEVTLTVSECEIFSLLSSVDPNAAHWYIVDAISRARGPRVSAARPAPLPAAGPAPSRLNPEASEFRCASTETQTEPAGGAALPAGLQPPPGFESHFT